METVRPYMYVLLYDVVFGNLLHSDRKLMETLTLRVISSSYLENQHKFYLFLL